MWSYFLIIYGIKFGPEKQKQWLISTFSGIAQDNFLNQPFNIVKQLAIAFAIYTLATLLFESAGSGPVASADVMALQQARGTPKVGAQKVRAGASRRGSIHIGIRRR